MTVGKSKIISIASKNNNKITTSQIKSITNLTDRKNSQYINELIKDGFLESDGYGKYILKVNYKQVKKEVK